MNYFFMILIVLMGCIEIMDLKSAFKCKREQDNNEAGAFIYVGDKKIVWILGMLSYLISILEWLILLFTTNSVPLFLSLLCCCIVQLGLAAFLWKHFTYSAIFIKENEVFFYDKRKRKNILIEQIAGVSAMPGNAAYLFLDKDNERLFELQMKKANANKMMEYIVNSRQNKN